MAFPQLPSFMSGQSQDNNETNSAQQTGLDSITLGQLKAMVVSVPKPKACRKSRLDIHKQQCADRDVLYSNRIMISDMMMKIPF
jgi:hypothetical protein